MKQLLTDVMKNFQHISRHLYENMRLMCLEKRA